MPESGQRIAPVRPGGDLVARLLQGLAERSPEVAVVVYQEDTWAWVSHHCSLLLAGGQLNSPAVSLPDLQHSGLEIVWSRLHGLGSIGRDRRRQPLRELRDVRVALVGMLGQGPADYP